MVEGQETLPEPSLFEAVKAAQALEMVLGSSPSGTRTAPTYAGAKILRFKVTLDGLGATSAKEGQRFDGAPVRRAN